MARNIHLDQCHGRRPSDAQDDIISCCALRPNSLPDSSDFETWSATAQDRQRSKSMFELRSPMIGSRPLSAQDSHHDTATAPAQPSLPPRSISPAIVYDAVRLGSTVGNSSGTRTDRLGNRQRSSSCLPCHDHLYCLLFFLATLCSR